MTRRALLVTGSRVLAGSECERMARDVVSRAIEGVDAVVVGDASGPDEWAFDAVVSHGWIVRRYCLDGTVVGEAWDVRRRWIDAPTLEAAPPARVPLLRNAAMVGDLATRAARADEWKVRYLALVAGWATTHGTEHTARLARDAGIRGVTVRFEVDR